MRPANDEKSPATGPASPSGRVRARALGLRIGRYRTGPLNAITDVSGVRVGHTTVIRGTGKAARGRRRVRTGVTAILPNAGDVFFDRVVGGGFVLNGAGEVSGLTQTMEWGLIETPILLTNTLSVGIASEAAVRHMVSNHPGIGTEHDVVIPVVGECDDSWLNDIAGRHLTREHVLAAIEGARSGPVAEGNVGGGTGMVTCDFKGGIGTSSRRLPVQEGAYTVGVLVMSNFGEMRDLRVDGLPVGELLEPEMQALDKRRENYGSIIAVVATDAPLLPHQVGRICKRAALGIGRVGSCAAHGSGEIVVGFSTANTVPRQTRRNIARVRFLLDNRLNPLYRAAIEATEEAIINALCMAEDMEGQGGHFCPALPLDRVREILQAHGAIKPIRSRKPKEKAAPSPSR